MERVRIQIGPWSVNEDGVVEGPIKGGSVNDIRILGQVNEGTKSDKSPYYWFLLGHHDELRPASVVAGTHCTYASSYIEACTAALLKCIELHGDPSKHVCCSRIVNKVDEVDKGLLMGATKSYLEELVRLGFMSTESVLAAKYMMGRLDLECASDGKASDYDCDDAKVDGNVIELDFAS